MFAEGRELLDRGRPVQIAGDEQRGASLLFQVGGELGGGGCLAGAVQADHEDARGLVEIERAGVAAEERGQLVMENLHDLLAGRDTAQDFFAQRLVFHLGDELFRHLVIDVGLEEREAHLAHGVGDVHLRDRAVAAEILEDVLQFIAEL